MKEESTIIKLVVVAAIVLAAAAFLVTARQPKTTVTPHTAQYETTTTSGHMEATSPTPYENTDIDTLLREVDASIKRAGTTIGDTDASLQDAADSLQE